MLRVDLGSISAVRQSEYADGCGNSLNTERTGKREKSGEPGPKGGLGDGESTGFNSSVDSNGSWSLYSLGAKDVLLVKSSDDPLLPDSWRPRPAIRSCDEHPCVIVAGFKGRSVP